MYSTENGSSIKELGLSLITSCCIHYEKEDLYLVFIVYCGKNAPRQGV